MKEKVASLRKKQKATLEKIYKSPVPPGIKWADIESLNKALGGEVKEGRGLRCKFILNGRVAIFHCPHLSAYTDKSAIINLREWLESTGVKQ
ncbi:HicA family protein [Trabulsiella guamensis ATCC 49490]|uniref:HicA family protein n=1 Tax=Trabulsiella guamensis ATCC 49490 TaxID=1005994 RepID=A0A084ZQC9_9ENTR|nr:hypothetical protein [Trabulsiella guamensis]KFB99673.1 HicA family protein [Trabulsiella guamensis ATCC 49490]